jgi:hypothetical protein
LVAAAKTTRISTGRIHNDNIVADNILQELQRQFQHQDDGAYLMFALSFLDVKTLLQNETVHQTWRKLCNDTTDVKCGEDAPKAFQSNQELILAVVTLLQVRNSIHGRD